VSYIDELLGQGEEIIFETRHHWFMLLARVLTKLVLLVLLIAAAVIAPQAFPTVTGLIWLGALVLGAFVVLSALLDYLHWSYEQYIVTDRRVIQLHGVLNKSVLDSSLEKINDVELNQSFLGRICGFGNLEILTASQEGINRFEHIAQPLQFKKAMLDARARYDHYLDRTPVQAYAGPPNLQSMLSQLAALHQSGILTDAEFESKKRTILSRI
jgi:uncharacterized membrane protein YdbT with pleckstrin-like domain